MLARKSILIISSRFVMSLMGFISLYFIAHNILQNFMGSVASAISILGLIGTFTDLGYSQAHIKRVSEGKDLGTCVGTYLTIKAVLLSLFVLVTVGGIWIVKNVLNVGFETSYDENVIYLMLFWSVASGFSIVVTNTFIGLQKMAKAQIVLVISALVQSVATIILVVNNQDIYLYTLLWPIGAVTNLLIGAYLFRKISIKPPTWEYFKNYTKFALPLMLVIGAGPIALYLDKAMLKFFWSNEDVAVYHVAQKYILFPDQMSQAVSIVLFPAFSEMISKGSRSMVRSVTLQAERYLSMAIFPMSFILIAISKPMFSIFVNVTFEGASLIFSILLGWVILRTLNRPYLVHFGAFDKPKYALYQTIIFIPINLMLNLIFIPDSLFGMTMLGMGGVGAAIASLISVGVSFLIARILSRRLIKIPFNWRILRHIVAAAIPSLLILFFRWDIMELTRFYEVIGAGILGGGMYLLLLAAFREITKKDVDLFLDAFSIRKMFFYIREEVFHK